MLQKCAKIMTLNKVVNFNFLYKFFPILYVFVACNVYRYASLNDGDTF